MMKCLQLEPRTSKATPKPKQQTATKRRTATNVKRQVFIMVHQRRNTCAFAIAKIKSLVRLLSETSIVPEFVIQWCEPGRGTHCTLKLSGWLQNNESTTCSVTFIFFYLLYQTATASHATASHRNFGLGLGFKPSVFLHRAREDLPKGLEVLKEDNLVWNNFQASDFGNNLGTMHQSPF